MFIRLHPATDLFMMGVVNARITFVGKEWIGLYHSQSNTNHRFPANKAAKYFLDRRGNFIATGTQNPPN